MAEKKKVESKSDDRAERKAQRDLKDRLAYVRIRISTIAEERKALIAERDELVKKFGKKDSLTGSKKGF